MERHLTRDDLMKYVSSLGIEMQQMFWRAESFAKHAADTLDESYQVAAAIEEVFWKRATEKNQ